MHWQTGYVWAMREVWTYGWIAEMALRNCLEEGGFTDVREANLASTVNVRMTEDRTNSMEAYSRCHS